MSSDKTPPQTFHGSCHCQYIQYTVSLSLPATGPPTASRCNCTICLKTGFTGIMIPESDFHLTSPSSLEELSDYQFNLTTVHRYSCAKCGVNVCGKGVYEFSGQRVEFFSLNVLTLDQPQDGLDLSRWKMLYVDGRNDNFAGGKKDSPYPGGCV